MNDLTRGEGAYEKTLTAFKIAKGAGMKVIFHTVLTKHNVQHIDFILDLSSRLHAGVRFGPVYYIHNLHSLDGIISSLFPAQEDYSWVIDRLIYAKRKGGLIVNSFSALQHMRHWPRPSSAPCYGGKAFCHISPDGRLYPCAGLEHKNDSQVHINNSFESTFNALPNITSCDGCWCSGTLEFNLALAFKPAAVFALAKLA